MSFLWSDDEELLMEANNHLSREEMVSLLLAKGYQRRTLGAIKSKRAKMGLPQREPPRYFDNQSLKGWPAVASDPIEQDRNYMRALVQDLQRLRLAA